jgi:protein-disulfide isomerase
MRMDLWDDFTCPHCKILHDQILSRIIADYVTPGKAYLVFQEFTLPGPGHENSRTASMSAAAAARVFATTPRSPTRCSSRSPRGQ